MRILLVLVVGLIASGCVAKRSCIKASEAVCRFCRNMGKLDVLLKDSDKTPAKLQALRESGKANIEKQLRIHTRGRVESGKADIEKQLRIHTRGRVGLGGCPDEECAESIVIEKPDKQEKSK